MVFVQGHEVEHDPRFMRLRQCDILDALHTVCRSYQKVTRSTQGKMPEYLFRGKCLYGLDGSPEVRSLQPAYSEFLSGQAHSGVP